MEKIENITTNHNLSFVSIKPSAFEIRAYMKARSAILLGFYDGRRVIGHTNWNEGEIFNAS